MVKSDLKYYFNKENLLWGGDLILIYNINENSIYPKLFVEEFRKNTGKLCYSFTIASSTEMNIAHGLYYDKGRKAYD